MQANTSSETKQFAGVASGLPTDEWVDELTRVDRMAVAPLVGRSVKLLHQLDWHDTVRADLSALREVLRRFDSPDQVARLTATCDHPEIRASCRSEAVPGTHHLEVLRVSRAQRSHSALWEQAEGAPSPALAPGWLQLRRTGAAAPWRQRMDGAMTVEALAGEITGAGLGVVARVLARRSEAMLMANLQRADAPDVHLRELQLTALRPGLAHAFVVEEAYDAAAEAGSEAGSEAGLRLRLSTPPHAEACNTCVRVDHHDVEMAYGDLHLRDVVAGVDLRLTSPLCEGFQGVVRVDVDVSGMRTQLDDFVEAYNAAMRTLTAATRRPSAQSALMQGHADRTIREAHAEHERKLGHKPPPQGGEERDTLHANSALRMVRDAMQHAVSCAISGVKPFSSALDVGLQPKRQTFALAGEGQSVSKPQAEGELEVRAGAFERAATLSPQALSRLLCGDAGLGVRGVFRLLEDTVDPMLRADGLALHKESVQRELDHHISHIDRHEDRVQRNRATNRRRFGLLEQQMGNAQLKDTFLSASRSGGGAAGR